MTITVEWGLGMRLLLRCAYSVSLIPRPSITANVVEGLVNSYVEWHQVDIGRRGLWRRAYTSTALHRKCHASQRLPDVILCRSFIRPSTMLAVIEGLGTRLYSLSVHLRDDNLYWVDKFHVYMWFHSAIWLVPPDLGTGIRQLLLWMIPDSLLPVF